MKRGLPFLALLLAGVQAQAQTSELGRFGVWTVTREPGIEQPQLCVLRSGGSGGRGVTLRAFDRDGPLFFELAKEGWEIPARTRLRVELRFDGGPAWRFAAEGEGRRVFWATSDSLPRFVRAWSGAARMGLSFPEGDEPAWDVSMAGSAAAMTRFAECLEGLRPARPTQPFGRPAEPEPARPTQPFSRPGGAT
jgi:hypothetical protein